MKKYIKISLIALVVIGIVGSLSYYLHSLGEGAEARISVPPFEQRIATNTSSAFKDAPYERARGAFDSISVCIETERSIWLSDGQRAVSSEAIKHSQQILFDGYAPIFVTHADQTFAQSAWNADNLRDLREQAQALKALGAADPGTDAAKQLASTIQTVNDYFAAMALVSSASHCTSVAGVQQIRSSVNRFKHAPLSNNLRLMAALNNAPAQARNNCASALAARANRVTNYSHYSSYDAFYAAYESMKQQIARFTSTLGGHSSLSSALTKLNSANSRALDYFSDRIQPQPQPSDGNTNYDF